MDNEIMFIKQNMTVGSRWQVGNKVYEILRVMPYSDECNTPKCDMIAIDEKSIEEAKEIAKAYNNKNSNLPITENDVLTNWNIETGWFINRKAKLIQK